MASSLNDRRPNQFLKYMNVVHETAVGSTSATSCTRMPGASASRTMPLSLRAVIFQPSTRAAVGTWRQVQTHDSRPEKVQACRNGRRRALKHRPGPCLGRLYTIRSSPERVGIVQARQAAQAICVVTDRDSIGAPMPKTLLDHLHTMSSFGPRHKCVVRKQDAFSEILHS